MTHRFTGSMFTGTYVCNGCNAHVTDVWDDNNNLTYTWEDDTNGQWPGFTGDVQGDALSGPQGTFTRMPNGDLEFCGSTWVRQAGDCTDAQAATNYDDAAAIFEQFDGDNSGGIDSVELFAALSDFGLTAAEIDNIFFSLDRDGCVRALLGCYSSAHSSAHSTDLWSRDGVVSKAEFCRSRSRGRCLPQWKSDFAPSVYAGGVRSFKYSQGYLEEGNDLLATSLTLQQAMQACADAGDTALGFCWNGDKDPTSATVIWVKSSASSSVVTNDLEGWHTRLMLPPAQFRYHGGFLEEGNDIVSTWSTLSGAIEASSGDKGSIGFCWSGDKGIMGEDTDLGTQIWVKNKDADAEIMFCDGWHTMLKVDDGSGDDDVLTMCASPLPIPQLDSLKEEFGVWTGDALHKISRAGDRNVGFATDPLDAILAALPSGARFVDAEFPPTASSVGNGTSVSAAGGAQSGASIPDLRWLRATQLLSGRMSTQSVYSVTLHVINDLDHDVNVQWLGFSGETVEYAVLPNEESQMEVETYETHVWCFVHPETGEEDGLYVVPADGEGGRELGDPEAFVTLSELQAQCQGKKANCRMSTQSVYSVTLHVINDLDHHVNVQWLGFSGETVEYAELPNEESQMEVETAGTHVWCFVHPETGEEDVLYVVPSDEGHDLIVTLSELQAQRQGKTANAAAGLQLFCQGTCSASDVMQGNIGDCWLMQSLASVANRFPDSVMSSFNPCNGPSPSGVYTIKMWSPRRKHFFYMVVDDFLPTQDGSSPYFCRCNAQGGGMWVTLLEKAFAKIQGSYAQLDSTACTDNPASALCRMLGGEASSRQWYENDHAGLIASLELWEEMVARRSGGTSCSTLSSARLHRYRESVDNHSGLVSFHGYTLMDLTEIEGFRLLKIRNVWGNTEWKGHWSDHSKLWDENPKVKEHCAMEQKDDGIFWMAYPDFVKFFCMIWHN